MKYPISASPKDYDLLTRLKVHFGLSVKVGRNGDLDVYLSYCPNHGKYFLDVLHGYPRRAHTLCPECLEEILR